MKTIKEKISLQELNTMASKMFGNLVKAVVDIEREILVVDSDLHSDQEAYFLQEGSEQHNLWGINIYPSLEKDERIEFDSMINLRPSDNNNSRGVEDKDIQEQIIRIVNAKISE